MRARLLGILLICLLFFSFLSVSSAQEQRPLLVLGWLEEAGIEEFKFRLHAKLDTGADTSSIHAENIDFFKKGEKEWVRFEVANRYGERVSLERRVRRYAEIKRKKSSAQIRPVVRIRICVGSIHENVEFSLVDRSNFSSAALIGRNFLSGKILVDSADSYTVEPSCASELKQPAGGA